jgi:Ca-activated chloride channel family protein
MSTLRRLVLALAVALVVACAFAPVAAPSRAQDPGPTLIVNQLDWSAYPQMRAVVTVLGADGIPVPDLVPSQFQAFDGDRQLRVTAATPAQDQERRLDVVVTIDVSGSMAGEPLALAKSAATEFIQSLGENDRAAVVAFSDEVLPVLGLTGDKEALATAINGLAANGGTALFEAVQVSTFLAGATAAEGNRAAVVFLSDGENETAASDATAEGSLDSASGSGIPVYPIAFGSLPDLAYLQMLAAQTRGLYREATPGTLGEVYREISNLLRSQYVVEIIGEGEADASEGTLQIIALVGSSPAATLVPFTRGVVAPPAPVSTVASGGVSPEVTVPESSSGGGFGFAEFALYSLAAMAVLGALGGGAYGVRRWQLNRREVARQLAVIAPNAKLAAAQGLPRRAVAAAPREAVAPVMEEAGTGKLVERGGEGRVIEIGAGPIILGTSPRVCHVVLHNGGSIAPEHARIWLRGRRYVLHHVGGMSRKTFVSGHEADWVGLDSGDTIVIGRWQFVFRDGSPGEDE